MQEVTEAVLGRMVDVIAATCHPERIILFGSRTTPPARPDADVDLLVIVPHPFANGRERLDETTRIGKALLDFDFPIDILLYSRDEVEARRNDARHVLARAMQTGNVVYDETG